MCIYTVGSLWGPWRSSLIIEVCIYVTLLTIETMWLSRLVFIITTESLDHLINDVTIVMRKHNIIPFQTY